MKNYLLAVGCFGLGAATVWAFPKVPGPRLTLETNTTIIQGMPSPSMTPPPRERACKYNCTLALSLCMGEMPDHELTHECVEHCIDAGSERFLACLERPHYCSGFFPCVTGVDSAPNP